MDDSLAVISTWTGTFFDGVWQFILDLDPQEILKARRMQKMALARYGRQSLLQWDDVEVSELRAWYDALVELVEREHAVQKASEME